jgi:aminoglycoside 3-N-acetyltransferase
MLTKPQLVEAFRGAGLTDGDLALVHSSLRTLGPVDGGADTVIDALLESLGSGGTLVLPTHTWKVVNAAQPVFHQTLTPSNVGVLTNVFRQRPGVLRSLHPTHSVAALGPRAAALVAGDERSATPCPADGPYGRLRDWGGKILIIGERLNCCTFFHGCEEWAGLSGLVRAEPTQLYSITASGRVIPVVLHSHHINTWDQYSRLEAPLVELGALRVSRLGECELRFLDAKRAADWLVEQLRRDAAIILLPDDVTTAKKA